MCPKNEEIRSKWVRAIPRKDWIPTPSSLNFSLLETIMRLAKSVLEDGLLLSALTTKDMLLVRLSFNGVTEPKSAFNANQYMLSFDDQLAIENLYGKKKKDEIIEFPTTIVEGSSSSSSTNPTVKDKLVAGSKTITLPDLCKIEQKLDTFLIVNRKIYVFYNKYVWFMELDDRMYRDPLIITDWLNFLPKDFKRIDAVYQRPNGEIVFFINDQIFIMSYPSFKLVKEYSINFPYQKVSEFIIRASNRNKSIMNFDKDAIDLNLSRLDTADVEGDSDCSVDSFDNYTFASNIYNKQRIRDLDNSSLNKSNNNDNLFTSSQSDFIPNLVNCKNFVEEIQQSASDLKPHEELNAYQVQPEAHSSNQIYSTDSQDLCNKEIDYVNDFNTQLFNDCIDQPEKYRHEVFQQE
ncbi:hypothetical protein RN001_003647 [Aquatica leii]|uniref:Uncharacterized protein n=1 Tax=Aquatica leii TaxID=1421715 RepID=A0AAN7PRD4_9COLE|nr:hypothetical protein RN001_003647 [Aquatica leii]